MCTERHQDRDYTLPKPLVKVCEKRSCQATNQKYTLFQLIKHSETQIVLLTVSRPRDNKIGTFPSPTEKENQQESLIIPLLNLQETKQANTELEDIKSTIDVSSKGWYLSDG